MVALDINNKQINKYEKHTKKDANNMSCKEVKVSQPELPWFSLNRNSCSVEWTIVAKKQTNLSSSEKKIEKQVSKETNMRSYLGGHSTVTVAPTQLSVEEQQEKQNKNNMAQSNITAA